MEGTTHFDGGDAEEHVDENRHFIVPPRRHSFPPRKRSRVCIHFVTTSPSNIFKFYFGIEAFNIIVVSFLEKLQAVRDVVYRL